MEESGPLSRSLSQRERAGPAAQRWEAEGLSGLPPYRRAVGRRTPSPQPSPHGRGGAHRRPPNKIPLSGREGGAPATRWEGEWVRSFRTGQGRKGGRIGCGATADVVTPHPPPPAARAPPSLSERGISAGRATAARSAVLEQSGSPSGRIVARFFGVTQ